MSGFCYNTSMKTKTKSNKKPASELNDLVIQLQQENETQALELRKQKSETLKWQDKYNALLENFKLAQQKRFGSSSEKCPDQAELFDEADAPVSEEIPENNSKTITVPAHERKPKGQPKRIAIPEHFERERIEHDIPEEDKICSCGCQKHRIGEEVSEQMEVIPPQFKVSQHVRPKYACKACEEGVSIAPMPKLFLPKSMAGPSLVAYTIINKYEDHLPLYRQETIWNRHGFRLPRNTLCGWVMAAFERVEPLLPLLKEDIVNSGYTQADETTVQVMKESGRRNQKKSYMWVYRGNAPNYTAILYDYQETREAKHPKAFLSEFTGFLQTDGYNGYDWVDDVKDITHLACMAHARRPFAKLLKISTSTGQSDVAIKLIGELYQIESKAREQQLSPKERYELRQKESKPLLETLKVWLDKMALSSPPKSVFGKGITYMLTRWPELTNFLKDGCLEIDNNMAENSIRPFAVGRKNWMFKGSPRGAKAGACFYSLIETCKANGVDPFKYLNYLFLHIPHCKTEEDYRKLLPYNIESEILA